MKIKTIISLVLLAAAINLAAADKYAGDIFTLGAGVRNFALGSTGVADKHTKAAAYWNASFVDSITTSSLELMHASHFDGLLAYDIAALNWARGTRFSAVLCRIGVDDIPLTALTHPDEPISNDNRPYRYKSVNNADYIFYLGFARTLTPGLNLGISPKVAWRNLAEETAWGFGVDLAANWQATSNFLLAARLRDALGTYMFWSTGTSETVTPGLDLEAAFNFTMPMLNTQTTLYAGIETYFEGREEAATFSSGAASGDPHLGLEIFLSEKVAVLAGLNRQNPTAGLTVAISTFNVAYAFEHDSELESSHRIGLGVNF